MDGIGNVPLEFIEDLFPHPDLSISDFLNFPLPIQLSGMFGVNHISTSEFWSQNIPEPLEKAHLYILQKVPVPSPQTLDLCRQEIESGATHQQQIKSIICGHLPATDPQSTRSFPLWIFDFWCAVSQLRQYVRAPWKQAENWAAHQDLLHFHERAILANEIHDSLSTIPWTGNVLGFSQAEPMTKVAHYLSNKWLSTTHIDQQLDILRLKLANHDQFPTVSKSAEQCEVVDTQFFPKIISIFRHSRSSYTKESALGGARHIFALGEDLSNPLSMKTMVCGVFNVLDSHWVSLVIDTEQHKILYGDSMEPNRAVMEEAVNAVSWWISVHMLGEFAHVDLPITRQVDSFSCGVFAVNSIHHLLCHETGLLQPHGSITERYRWFLNVIKQHNATVCTIFYQIALKLA